MASLRYYLVLVVLTVVTLSCFIAVVTYGFWPIGLAAGLGVLLGVAVFFSYGLTMRTNRTPINR